MDQPKIERMLRLMKMMSGNTNYTIDELAEKHSINVVMTSSIPAEEASDIVKKYV